jgi:hypothetical protein
LNNLINFLTNIQPEPDKLSHLFYGSIITLMLFVITKKPQIMLLIVIALIKEINDIFNVNSLFEISDIIYSVIPSIILFMIIKYKSIKIS